MKTSKEFFERLQSDEAFAKEVAEKIKAKADAGEQDYKAVLIPVAAEYDYELTGEELDELYEKASADLSDEELGRVSGGLFPFAIPAIISVSLLFSASTVTVSLEATSVVNPD